MNAALISAVLSAQCRVLGAPLVCSHCEYECETSKEVLR